MSSLAEPISFNAPPQSWMKSVQGSHSVKLLFWAGLSPNTRKGYQSAIRLYEYYTKYIGTTTWPATTVNLKEWAAGRLMGSSIAKQAQIKPETVAFYLSTLRSWHIDQEYSTSSFKSRRMKLLLAGGRSFFPSTKLLCLPITKNILQILTSAPAYTLNDLNLYTAFKVTWAGFMRLGEITYTAAEKVTTLFKDLHLTRSDITFSEKYATLRLKRSKTNTNHTRVLIMLAATNDSTCPVTALRSLFTHNPQPPHAPLFAFNNASFSRQYVIDKLRARLLFIGVSATGFSGHSFRRDTAQNASDNGMLDKDIQKLGRWTSASFRLYFVASAQTLFNLNMNF